MAALRSIRGKLMRVILLTSASILLLTFASYFFYELFSYRQFTIRQLRILGQVVASNSTAALAFESTEDADEILSALKAETNISKACLYRADGKIISVYPDSATVSDFPALRNELGFEYSDSHIQGFIAVQQGDKRLGTLFIQRNTNDIYYRLILYIVIAGVIISLCFLIAFLLSNRLQNRISAPIIELARTSTEISRNHDYSIRARTYSDDEIGLLTQAFNTMLSRIEIQNQEIELAKRLAQQHATELEAKVAERTVEYKRQKDFAEAVVNSSLVLIAVFDRDTRIVGFNKRCEEEFGMTREEVLGKKLEDAMPQAKGSLTHTSLLNALQGQVVHNPRYRSQVTGYYYESFVVPLLNEHNEVYAALMTAHNITDLVEASEKLQIINIELQRKNSELEQFAYVASHDLQEPLRKIQTFIQLAKRNYAQGDSAERYMDKIETSAGRMSALIKDVLEYSRLSQLEESFTPTDLNAIVENVKSDFELLIQQTGTTIRHSPLPIISGNKLQLHQLFANLIGNSIKFSDKSPVITISASGFSPENVKDINGLDPQVKYVELTFSDNGIGFDTQYAEKIFTIFQRLNNRDKYEGTGIGLALCKRIVENHHGHISVDSSPGVGTTFKIVLPE